MESIIKINIKIEHAIFFDVIIKIKDFNPDLLKIEKKTYKNIDIYYIRYMTIKYFN